MMVEEKTRREWELVDVLLAVLGSIALLLVVTIFSLDMLPVNHTSEVYITKPLLSVPFCNAIVQAAEEYATKAGAGWTKQRHRNYPTTDIPLFYLNSFNITQSEHAAVNLVGFINESVVRAVIFPQLYSFYHISPLPASSLLDSLLHIHAQLSVRDVFVVKYDAQSPASQRRLQMHVDSSLLSFNIALSPHVSAPALPLNDSLNPGYSKGGTRFLHHSEPLLLEQGAGLLHPSRLFHEGVAIEQGKRFVLVGFVNVLFRSSWQAYVFHFGRLGRCIRLHYAGGKKKREEHCISGLYLYSYEVYRAMKEVFTSKEGEDFLQRAAKWAVIVTLLLLLSTVLYTALSLLLESAQHCYAKACSSKSRGKIS